MKHAKNILTSESGKYFIQTVFVLVFIGALAALILSFISPSHLTY